MGNFKKLLATLCAACLAGTAFASEQLLAAQPSDQQSIAHALGSYDDDLVMRYTSSAGTKSTDNAWDNSESFYRALPLGNGRIGAMIYGNCPTEWIDLNECTVWSAGPGSNDRDGAGNSLKTVQDLLSQEKYDDANSIIGSKMIGGGQAKYQKVGMLKLSLGHENVSDYSRQLDMNTAVASTSYSFGGKKYTRESFVSYPNQVMVTRISCDAASSVSLAVGYDGLLNGTVTEADNNTIIANGHGDDDCWVKGAVYYSARTKVVAEGGSVSTGSSRINVQNADSVMILTTIRTNFVNAQLCNGDEKGDAAKDMQKLDGMTYKELYDNHVADYQALFQRVDVELGGNSSVTNSKTIEARIAEFNQTNDPKMVETLFQYGRYLMIAASRDAQAMNLQGIWNKYSSPAWGSKSTTNINYEMNYWPAFTTNLAECFEPFIEKAKALTVSGAKTAQVHYNINTGWVLHHNTDIWNRTGPIDGTWGQWPVGGAWVSNMLYDAYKFNQNADYLEEIYPVIQGSASFLNALMIPQNIEGQTYMVISPSASPELNIPGKPDSYCAYGITMDNAISRELFQDVVDASTILGKDASFRSELQEKLSLIKPATEGRYGQLEEWAYDWDNPNETHRHISHIYGLFPGNEYSPATNPDIAEAAATALNHRGDDGTGWSEAWKLNCWARLEDGEHAYNLVKLMISPVDKNGRLYANLWDAHPPFQIDGNFGFTSGVAEMLLQSQNDEVVLLPALPQVWDTGHANGLCARGGFEISEMNWKNGRLTDVTILSNAGCVCNLRYGNARISFETQKGGVYHLNGLLRFTDDAQVLGNLAKGKSASASVGTAAPAIDGQADTMWSAKGNLNGEWLSVDLGEQLEIRRWTVKLGGVNGDINFNARDLRLQYSSDGTNWKDADVVYGNTKSTLTRNLPAFSAQFVRLCLDTSTQNNAGGVQVAEFEVWGAADGSASSVSAYSKMEAENCDFLFGGIQVENHDTWKDIGYIQNGSAAVVCGVDFGGGAEKFQIHASSATEGCTVELHLGSEDGTLVGECTVNGTGDWAEYDTFECNVKDCAGVQDLYLVFRGDDGYLCNVDWFSFSYTAMRGDLNGDKQVDARDLAMLKKLVLSSNTVVEPTLTAADWNQDGKVNASDADAMLQFLLG